MISIYHAKTKFQNILRPIVRWLFYRGVTANRVTLTAMFISIALGCYLWVVVSDFDQVVLLGSKIYYCFLLIPLWMFVRMALNAIDGMLAREHGQGSKLGAILNEVGDVVSDVALYFPFIGLVSKSGFLLFGVIFLAVMTEFVGVLAQSVGGVRRYDGPMGKSDRAFIFGAWAVFLPWLYAWDLYFYSILALLLLMTIYKRIKGSLSDAKQNLS